MDSTSSNLRTHTTSLPVSADLPERQQAISPARRAKGIFRYLRILLLLVALFFVYKVATIGYYGWNVYQSVQQLQQIAANPTEINALASLQLPVRRLNQGITGLEQQLRMATPILRRLGVVPTYGGVLANSPELLIAGKELTAILDEGLTVVGPALAAQKPLLGEDSVVSSLTHAKTHFTAMSQHAVVATAALEQVDLAALHPTLAANGETIRMLLHALPAAFRLAPSIPYLLGSEKSQTYLVLIQNNHELRATGGFISAVGKIKLDYGEISEMDFADSYTVYVQGNTYPKAPAAQQKYMRIPIMLFRDGNWSPDLPTSAQSIKAIYFQDTGATVNGIVTIDINAVQTLIDALGPLTIGESGEVVTGKNVVDVLKQLWERPLVTDETVKAKQFDVEWWKRRKDFVPQLAKAVVQKLKEGDFEKLSLLKAALSILDRRFVQVWVDDADAAKAFAWLGWDGSLAPEAATDYLALVDSNMGYNKVDSVLTRSLDYQVSWQNGDNEPAQATVSVVYEHPFAVPAEDQCDQTPRYGDTYDEMAARCYFDYVRLYTPSGSTLIQTEGFVDESVESLRGEKGTQIFAGYFVMKPGTKHLIRFTYTLPNSIKASGYRLIVQKQSGLTSLPLTLAIDNQTFKTDLASGTLHWDLQSAQ